MEKYRIPIWLDPSERDEHIDLLIASVRKHGYRKGRTEEKVWQRTTYKGSATYIDEIFEFDRRQSELLEYIKKTPRHERSFEDWLKKRK